ncbi:TadE/TadG family type IV pilus assembly protein [Pseudovibrio sp. Ad37]|uniref:TadE/TadG family type IV pilus assembly protein n=1 Tax=Pseudovibrio sp. Ad37 TaxID=989422 RepID=UPI0007AE69E5|nr:TadE/TadG family type IV pilus assembly protein [Pseudovibrio sp. Ad37]KZL28215.1 TadE-like protein [Pseudovibrio sp. Ad37]
MGYSKSRKLLSDNKGVTAIEFAIVAPMLFAIILAIIELGISFLVEVLLDNALADAARQIRTGQVYYAEKDGNYSKTKFKNVILDGGTGLLKSVEDKLYIDVVSFKNFEDIPKPKPIIKEGKVVMEQNWKPGGPSNVVLVRVVCAWPMITSMMAEIFGQATNGNRILVATEVFRNEPF